MNFFSSFSVCLTCLLGLASCGSNTPAITIDSVPETVAVIDTPKVNLDSLTHAQRCNITYDTITNPRYRFHKSMMDCYTVPAKRQYWFSVENDTLETFVHPQHIGVFMQELDSTEQGVYRRLTNKIVFLLLQHDSRHLGVVMNFNFVNTDYFLWHCGHPMCSEISIDSTIANVKLYMDDEKAIKQHVLASLAVAKSENDMR